MSEPSIDLEKPNAIGGLDRLVTNFAIAVVAVVPTFLTCVFRPWKLTSLMEQDDPHGRQGLLLAPGAYFALALMVAFMIGVILSTPETISNDGSYIGPKLALTVQAAAAEGKIWKVVGTVMPIYALAVFLGLLGIVLKPWAHPGWTLRVSLRAAFYMIATLITWLIITGGIIDLIRLSAGNNFVSKIYGVLIFPTSAFVLWFYYWVFGHDNKNSRPQKLALSAAMFGLIALSIFVTDMLVRM